MRRLRTGRNRHGSLSARGELGAHLLHEIDRDEPRLVRLGARSGALRVGRRRRGVGRRCVAARRERRRRLDAHDGARVAQAAAAAARRGRRAAAARHDDVDCRRRPRRKERRHRRFPRRRLRARRARWHARARPALRGRVVRREACRQPRCVVVLEAPAHIGRDGLGSSRGSGATSSSTRSTTTTRSRIFALTSHPTALKRRSHAADGAWRTPPRRSGMCSRAGERKERRGPPRCARRSCLGSRRAHRSAVASDAAIARSMTYHTASVSGADSASMRAGRITISCRPSRSRAPRGSSTNPVRSASRARACAAQASGAAPKCFKRNRQYAPWRAAARLPSYLLARRKRRRN